ncbi:hypothetical protein DFP75_10412 [Marinomonas alcarazii]|uniref:Uncharacterized protein n=1 Tax=Marinomonas alcarazii TaxID=491949 RepID=A0A318V5V2_9GAMM|nr:hypothetical protein DFP75_10412 [Marinomonas alcarazii]
MSKLTAFLSDPNAPDDAFSVLWKSELSLESLTE